MKEKYCFMSDDDGHKYIIPVSRRSTFNSLLKDGEIDDYVSFVSAFGDMMCDHPESYCFENPQKINESNLDGGKG